MAKHTFSKHSHDLTFKCPVCGHKNKYNSIEKSVGQELEIIYCDSDSGGCDQQIVLETNVTRSIKLKALKIEGLKYN